MKAKERKLKAIRTDLVRLATSIDSPKLAPPSHVARELRRLAALLPLLALTANAVTVEWEPSQDATGYVVYQSNDYDASKPWLPMASSSGTRVVLDIKRTPSDFFYVVATNGSVQSLPSDVASYPPEAPVIANATIGTNGVLLCWTIHGAFTGGPDPVMRFDVERATTNASVESVLTYRLLRPVSYVNATQLTRYSYFDTNALGTNTVTYRVRAYAFPAGDSSPWSEPCAVSGSTNASATLRLTAWIPGPAWALNVSPAGERFEPMMPPPLPPESPVKRLPPRALRMKHAPLPQAALRSALDGHQFACRTVNENGAFRIERAPTPSGPWEEILRNIAVPGEGVFIDCDATNAAAFYRMRDL